MSLPLSDAIKIGVRRLSEAGVADCEIDARELYCFQAGINRTGLMMRWTDVLQDNQCEAYFQLIDRRAERVPLQHITGYQAFMGLDFKVNEHVLIPRQDTETMVEDALELIEKGSLRGNEYRVKVKGVKPIKEILDLCTGSGAIGISIGKLNPNIKVTLSDISDEALKIAGENTKKHNLKSIKIVKSDMFEALKGMTGKKKFDLIISNPPYIRPEIIETLEPEVKEHEPMLALDGGEDGLDFYRIIAKSAPEHLKKGGVLMMEIGYDQKNQVKEILADTGAFDKIIGLQDLTGKDRIIVAMLKTA